MVTSEYVAAMRREHEHHEPDALLPECGHESERVETAFGETTPAWFEDADGNVRCCHPACIEQDWYGDESDAKYADFENGPDYARYFYGGGE